MTTRHAPRPRPTAREHDQPAVDRPAAGRSVGWIAASDMVFLAGELVDLSIGQLRTWAPRLADALDAELLASNVCGQWFTGPCGPGAALEALVGEQLVEALEVGADPPAVAALSALAAAGSAAVAEDAGRAAERLVAGGLSRPIWWSQLPRPVRSAPRG
ncbi:hypothetical protein [Patulibacter defluvii]|uniref:hypothetical protein n=1 Tax=Patulibacter defluvii TaxID=3095358 RepID=UPI002A758C69|nr:hypothetical protein [Patulibacter sp. DM4]